MKPNTDLFRLIKSLTRNEKGYFKKYAQVHGNTKNADYLLLFDEIDKQQDTYDEARLIARLKGKPMVHHLSVVKNYLFEMILKSLRSFHDQNLHVIKMDTLHHNVAVLAEKGLFDIAEKQAAKLEELSIEFDDKLMLLKLNKSRRGYLSEFDVGPVSVIDNLKLSLQHHAHYETDLNYAQLYLTVFGWLRMQTQVRSAEQLQQLEAFIQNPLLQQPPPNNTFHAHLYYHLTLFGYYTLIHNIKEQERHIKAIIHIWEKYPQQKKVQTIAFLSSVNNYFSFCYPNNQLDEFEQYLMQQTLHQNAVPSVQYAWFANVSIWKIIIHTLKHTLEESLQLANTVYHELNTLYAGKIRPSAEITLYNNCSIIFICAGKFEQSIDILNKLLDSKHILARKDIRVHLRIWYLIVHMELENDLLLENAIRAVKRYAINQEYYFEYEQLFMRFIQKYLNTTTLERPQLYAQLLQNIEELERVNELERSFIQRNYVLKLWVIHKITGENLFYLGQNYAKAKMKNDY